MYQKRVIQHTRPSYYSHLILWMSLLLMTLISVWAYHAELDEVTRGYGRVIPSSHLQVVQNLEGGIIAELNVKAGDIVEKDQVLLRIDDTRFASSYRESQLKAVDLEARLARLQAESQEKKFTIPKSLNAEQKIAFEREYQLYQSRQQTLQANLDVLNQQKQQRELEVKELKTRRTQIQNNQKLIQKELNITEPLVKKGVMSEIDLLRLQRENTTLRGDLETINASIPRVEAGVREVVQKIVEARSNFRNQAVRELNELQLEASQLSESSETLKDRVVRTAVRSPVRGTVKQVKMTTIGGVVQPGMDLVEIVPLEDSLLVEARVRPADIAFLRPGLAAMVKLTAYDFSIYGGLTAHLEHISADSLLDERGDSYFLIRVRTEKNYLNHLQQSLPIMPGMTAQVDILTGKKTVWSYLLKPIHRAWHNALQER
ncbi:HlyD family type I secretion periplasmic adaptor subunit [Thioflexithrix psekupsensis]|uniref:Membrane fusion protein (MFP) family protein n=1 Tax=Thioflexithrix psekupsensis TaxID=1570016 RepID=A0A251X8T9_9GAMM|nr:HlyD family type I secretion periplasmic adaptor subunit [Thioflexithrix psekupsensis]OUD14391.1 hemolysin secretion protein D [Thioflexithrix psekupsensis]